MSRRDSPGAIEAWVRLVHPGPSLLVAAVTAALIPLADRDAGWPLYVQLGLGMLCYQFAIGVTNDIVDVELDRGSGRPKPLATGAIGVPAASRLVAALVAVALLLTITLPLGAWLIGIAGFACGLLYNTGMKRTALSWLPLSVALPLVPVWVFVANDAWDALLWWTFPLGAILGFAIHAANQLPDIPLDRKAGVVGAFHRMQPGTARAAAIGGFGVAASAVVVILLFRRLDLALYAAVVGTVVGILSPRAAALFGRRGLFPLLASGTALLSLLFLAAA